MTPRPRLASFRLRYRLSGLLGLGSSSAYAGGSAAAPLSTHATLLSWRCRADRDHWHASVASGNSLPSGRARSWQIDQVDINNRIDRQRGGYTAYYYAKLIYCDETKCSRMSSRPHDILVLHIPDLQVIVAAVLDTLCPSTVSIVRLAAGTLYCSSSAAANKRNKHPSRKCVTAAGSHAPRETSCQRRLRARASRM